ncbi:UDP-N-acetylglucosamine transferase subunit [Carpediemonas membranifera]|uniref:UDP-N-acetylglucosamine transferase subunit ALG14 n=1 Tax=Carpediemonas membranifera TaxID=201153 RepID=A0A8J6AY51_9EUKA|nr:UDP-N-acetylglucosamine transferase subunit [Carpediemonas membranifera]|eukprot:KAG9390109.1 UDP-N-acetylglucosamine transferase subunit [Carpediemonas membranifera]
MVKTLIVLGSGGHTAEMMHLLTQVDTDDIAPRYYVHADSDAQSSQKAVSFEEKNGGKDYIIKSIPRARSVGQSYFTSIFTTLYAFIFAFVLILRIRPKLLLTDGPGTALPLVYSAFFLRFIGQRCRIIFVESFCRVESLSLAGRLCKPVVDRFIVHWPSLKTQGEYVPGLLF